MVIAQTAMKRDELLQTKDPADQRAKFLAERVAISGSVTATLSTPIGTKNAGATLNQIDCLDFDRERRIQ